MKKMFFKKSSINGRGGEFFFYPAGPKSRFRGLSLPAHAGRRWSAPGGPPEGLGGRPSPLRHGCCEGRPTERRAGPLGMARLACAAGKPGRRASGACERRAALKAHTSPASDLKRLVSALRGRRGGEEPMWLWCRWHHQRLAAFAPSVCALRHGGGRQGGGDGSGHAARDGDSRLHQRICACGPPALVMCPTWVGVGRLFIFF